MKLFSTAKQMIQYLTSYKFEILKTKLKHVTTNSHLSHDVSWNGFCCSSCMRILAALRMRCMPLCLSAPSGSVFLVLFTSSFESLAQLH